MLSFSFLSLFIVFLSQVNCIQVLEGNKILIDFSSVIDNKTNLTSSNERLIFNLNIFNTQESVSITNSNDNKRGHGNTNNNNNNIYFSSAALLANGTGPSLPINNNNEGSSGGFPGGDREGSANVNNNNNNIILGALLDSGNGTAANTNVTSNSTGTFVALNNNNSNNDDDDFGYPIGRRGRFNGGNRGNFRYGNQRFGRRGGNFFGRGNNDDDDDGPKRGGFRRHGGNNWNNDDDDDGHKRGGFRRHGGNNWNNDDDDDGEWNNDSNDDSEDFDDNSQAPLSDRDYRQHGPKFFRDLENRRPISDLANTVDKGNGDNDDRRGPSLLRPFFQLGRRTIGQKEMSLTRPSNFDGVARPFSSFHQLNWKLGTDKSRLRGVNFRGRH